MGGKSTFDDLQRRFRKEPWLCGPCGEVCLPEDLIGWGLKACCSSPTTKRWSCWRIQLRTRAQRWGTLHCDSCGHKFTNWDQLTLGYRLAQKDKQMMSLQTARTHPTMLKTVMTNCKDEKYNRECCLRRSIRRVYMFIVLIVSNK